MSARHTPAASTALCDCPVYWFTLMEAARRRYDFAEALRCKRELERLGVFISFRPTIRRPEGGGPKNAA